MSVITTHNAGFFSCCSVKLNDIVDFINTNKRLPDSVDSSKQFKLYKNNNYNDVTYEYFEHYNNIKNIEINYPINYNEGYQFIDYSKLDYIHLYPLIQKYFSPSKKIYKIMNNIIQKYKLELNNTLAVYYRGTDKSIETDIASFDEFYNQILNVIKIDKDIKILIQTDTAQFLDYINSKNLKNIIVIEENVRSYTDKGIHFQYSCKENFYHMLILFSTFFLISKCKYIICSSSNCSIFIMLYRNNNKNVIQYLDGTWYNSVI